MFGLGFLNSMFLVALSATLIPIIIHILNRRRIRKIKFSSLEFIHEISKRRMSKINFRRWLILLLRTLAVAFLVTAFARPTLQDRRSKFFPADAPTNVVICLDESYSMGVEREEGTAFSVAQQIAKQVVDESGRQDILNVVAFSSSPRPLFETGTRNKLAVKAAIDRLRVSAGGTSIDKAVEAAHELIRQSEISGGELYVISDFRDSGDSTVVAKPMENVRVLLLPVYKEAVENVSIDRVFSPRKLIRPGELVQVGVALTNHSRENPANFRLELLVDERRMGEKIVSLSPASSTTINFPVSFQRWGNYRCRVAKERDRLPIDDDRYFLIDVSKSVPVSVVRGRKRADDGRQAAAYFYVSKALNPRGPGAGEFNVSVVDENNFTASNLPRGGVVAWTDPQAMEPARYDLLKQFVHRGGALAIFLAGNRSGLWNDAQFLHYIGGKRAALKTKAEGERFASFQKDHPVFSLFNEEELELLSRSRLTRYVSVTGIAPDSILAYLGSGDPGIWEAVRGRGRILVFAAAPELTTGNLPLSPMFLPLIHTSVSFLASAGAAATGGENYIGSALHFDIPQWASARGAALEVTSGSGLSSRPLLYEAPGGQTQAIYEKPEEVGFYKLTADTAFIAAAAVNLDTKESNLNALPIRNDRTVGTSVIEASAGLAAALQQAKKGREVFAFFLLVAAAFLFLEGVLGRRA